MHLFLDMWAELQWITCNCCCSLSLAAKHLQAKCLFLNNPVMVRINTGLICMYKVKIKKKIEVCYGCRGRYATCKKHFRFSELHPSMVARWPSGLIPSYSGLSALSFSPSVCIFPAGLAGPQWQHTEAARLSTDPPSGVYIWLMYNQSPFSHTRPLCGNLGEAMKHPRRRNPLLNMDMVKPRL